MGRHVSRPSLFTGFLRRMAALLMLVAAAALAPAAIAGSFELGTDAAKLAASSFSIDADGCVTDPSLTSTDQQPTDAEHCPACCLHHHGPNDRCADGCALRAVARGVDGLGALGPRRGARTCLDPAPSSLTARPFA